MKISALNPKMNRAGTALYSRGLPTISYVFFTCISFLNLLLQTSLHNSEHFVFLGYR